MSGIVDNLRRELAERVRDDEETRRAHRIDTWVLSDLRDYRGEADALPMAVVEAESTADVSATLRACRAAGVPVIPFGGGSGVCGGVQAGEDAIVLSTRKMAGLVELDERELRAVFRAGTMGIDAEKRVQQDGLTIGHWPQSIELSTVGGWVATRASGQFSTAYGNIEDVLLALEVVLPDGSVMRTRSTPRASAGPDLRQLFMGSEGTLGVVTEVTFSLRPLPEASRGQAFHFEGLVPGLEPIRRFVRSGWRPPVVRLYDAPESQRNFGEYTPEGRALLLLLHEGPEAAVATEIEAVAQICREAGGEPVDSAVVDHWMGERNHVPTFRSFVEKGIMVDTIEVAATWDRVAPLYEAVTSSLREQPGVLTASAHSSHSYRSGTNLYFTFAVRPADRDDMESAYLECWKRTMDACVANGAGIAHHHGIGRVRRDRMPEELGETGVELLRTLKAALDPDGLLNPGNLIPAARR